MSEFGRVEERSFVVPVLLAAGALALAVLVGVHFFPATTVDIAHVRTELLPVVLTIKADSNVIVPDQSIHTLFIAETVRVENKHRGPIVVDSFTLTLTDPTGAQLTARAPLPSEVKELERTYPALVPLMATPLARETSIEAGQSAQGAVLFSFDIPQAVWDTRRSAVMAAEIYHQPTVYVTVPK